MKDERKGRPSASQIYRIKSCPGSWFAESKCRAEDETEDAKLGTYLHECLEKGMTPDDAEQAEMVEWCQMMESNLVERVFGDKKPEEVIREERMYYEGDLFSGKPDVIYWDEKSDTALILDYKFGRLPVESVESNLQLASLAVLFSDKVGHFPFVYAAVLQPYASKREPALVKYAPANIMAADDYIKKLIDSISDENAPLKPKESACRYCRAKTTCPAVSLALTQTTTLDLTGSWELWTPEKRRQAYDLAKIAKKWAVAVEAKIKADLKSEIQIPGLSLAEGRKVFTVTDTRKAWMNLAEALPGLSAEAFASCCKVGISDLDKLVHSLRKEADSGTKVMESKDWLRKTLAGCAETKVSDGSIKETEGGKE